MSAATMVTNLGRHRVNRTGSAKSWTPREMLRNLLERADAGELDLDQCVVIYPGTAEVYVVEAAGVTAGDHFEMLRAAMKAHAGVD